jgi:hypothetical protein
MLSRLVVSNFKGIRQSQDIPLRPLTFIFGPNNSGKTSLLQSLLLLKQTLEASEANDIVLLPKGNYIDLGGFAEFVHGHDTKRKFQIELRFVPSSPESFSHERLVLRQLGLQQNRELGAGFTFSSAGSPPSVSLERFDISYGETPGPLAAWNCIENRKPKKRGGARRPRPVHFAHESTQCLRLVRIWDDHPVFCEMMQRLCETDRIVSHIQASVRQLNKEIDSWSDAEEMEGRKLDEEAGAELGSLRTRRNGLRRLLDMLRGPQPFESKRLGKCLVDVSNPFVLPLQNFLPLMPVGPGDTNSPIRLHMLFNDPLPNLPGLAAQVSRCLRQELESIVYLGPLREFPERHYVYSGKVTRYVGKSGAFVPDLLYKEADLVKAVNRYLRKFGIPYRIEIANASGAGTTPLDVFAVRLIHKLSRTSMNLTDVGFGISQSLPILVQSLIATESILCIEQPELHLHPALQAELADVFIDSALGPRKNQFLIETHSEHLILRLMRRMRETSTNRRQGGLPVKPEDVSILYVQNQDSRSTVTPLRLDESGALLDPWPGGFFEEGFRERFD